MFSSGLQFISQEEWMCVYRLKKNILEILFHHLKVLSFVGWKHHTPQPLLTLIIKNILWFLPKTYLISFPAFGVLHLALQRGGCPSRCVFRKPGPDSNFEKHFPLFQIFIQPMVPPESLQFLFFTSLTKKSFHLRPRARLLWGEACVTFLLSLPYRRMKAKFWNLADDLNPSLPQCPSHEPFLIPSEAPYTSHRSTCSSEPSTQ